MTGLDITNSELMELKDRELLEMAAKAYVDDSWLDNPSYMEGFLSRWNPLENDGDALRLAVKCGIQFHIEGFGENEMVWANDVFAYTNGDSLTTTRLVIVRAAAKIWGHYL